MNTEEVGKEYCKQYLSGMFEIRLERRGSGLPGTHDSRDVSYHPDDCGSFCKTQSLQEYSYDWVVRGRATEEYIFVT